MSIELPALFERIEKGLTGGFRFEILMHNLLYAESGKLNFKYEDGPGVRDYGVDGWITGAYENLVGTTALQYKFISSLFDENKNPRTDVLKSIERAHAHYSKKINTYIIVSLSAHRTDELERFNEEVTKLFEEITFKIEFWSKQKVEHLLIRDQLMLNYFYPDKLLSFYPNGNHLDIEQSEIGYKQRLLTGLDSLNLAGSARAQLTKQKAKQPSLRDLYVPLRLAKHNSDSRNTYFTNHDGTPPHGK